MITAITIENFKGISEPVRLELRPITLLFGQNSAGKSSLLHALIYAREIFERQQPLTPMAPLPCRGTPRPWWLPHVGA